MAKGLINVGGGGSSGASFFIADTPPETPSAWDDEFDDGTIDASWVNYNLASGTKSEDETSHSMIIGAAGTGLSMQGIVKESPTGDFDVMCKICGAETNSASFRYGLVVAESTTGKAITNTIIGQGVATGGAVHELMNSPTNRASYGSIVTGIIPMLCSGYLKIHVYNDGGTWKATTYQSQNGVRYYAVSSAVSIGFTPAYVGLVANSEGVAGTNTGYFEWFRVNTL